MKKTFSLVLAMVMAFMLCVPAFAAAEDITLTYDLSSGGQHDIVVQTGDVITVTYSLSATEKTSVSVTQNEIYYDHNFFQIVEGSNKGSAGFTDYTTTLQERLSGKRYVYFNTIATHTHDTTPSEVGTFQLKVIATQGETTVANVNYMAFDISNQKYSAAAQDLHVSIGTPQTQKFTLAFNNEDGTVYKTIVAESGKDITIPDGPSKSGYTFSYWSVGGDSTQYKPGQSYTPTSDVTFTPHWTRNGGGTGGNTGGGGGGSGTTRYTIRASAGTGGSISPSGSVSVASGRDRAFTIEANSGYTIQDVQVDGKSVGAVSSYTFKNVTTNHTIQATFKASAATTTIASPTQTGVASWLETESHVRYLGGYVDNTFGPGKNMTRAEVAQMFYGLLLDQDVPITVSFSDVPSDAWYAKAVNTLASLGIVAGNGENFAPNKPITRAEFTTIAMKFTKQDTSGTNPFTDVKSTDWYYKFVVGSAGYGWIGGYSDGTFRPNNSITRAEVTTIVNHMLGRSADKTFADSHAADLKQFTDVSKSNWAYYEIVEATNAHEHQQSNGVETWTALK